MGLEAEGERGGSPAKRRRWSARRRAGFMAQRRKRDGKSSGGVVRRGHGKEVSGVEGAVVGLGRIARVAPCAARVRMREWTTLFGDIFATLDAFQAAHLPTVATGQCRQQWSDGRRKGRVLSVVGQGQNDGRCKGRALSEVRGSPTCKGSLRAVSRLCRGKLARRYRGAPPACARDGRTTEGRLLVFIFPVRFYGFVHGCVTGRPVEARSPR